MFDRLIVTETSARYGKKLRRSFLTASIVVITLVVVGFVANIFSQELSIGDEDLSISALVAPPEIPQSEPPEPEPIKQRGKSTANKTTTVPTRRYNIQRVDEPPKATPSTISSEKPRFRERPKSLFRLGGSDSDDIASSGGSGGTVRCSEDCEGLGGIGPGNSQRKDPPVIKRDIKKTVPEPPPIKKPPIKRVKTRILNGMAKRLVKPVYSSTARALGAKGKVTVQVVINERGNVVAASAIRGHRLLRGPAVEAARKSKFTPTILNGVPVKVSGMIVYNFRM